MLAYMCAHSGLYYPESYVKNWGIDGNGVGLGPDPVSECLNTNYHGELAVPTLNKGDAMHPVGVTRAALIPVQVTQAEFDANAAILHKDDPLYTERAKIIRYKQEKKSQSLRAHLESIKPKKEVAP